MRSLSGPWHRNLKADIAAVEAWGAAAVVSLIEEHEITQLGVEDIGAVTQEFNMLWFHLPIADGCAPDQRFEESWGRVGPKLRQLLRNGVDIVVHCKGGLGRAGTVAALLLVELGVEPSRAIEEVRRVRPGAIETAGQEDFVRSAKPVPVLRPSQTKDAVRDRGRGALLGLAVGDALGTALEFSPRDNGNRIVDMVGGGPFQLLPGDWTDDTSMALALADSLICCQALDADDLASRFVRWYKTGAYSPVGSCFDIGLTTRASLDQYLSTGDAFSGDASPDGEGNGSIMRLAPVALWYWRNHTLAMETARLQSRVTHGATHAVSSCALFAQMLCSAISGSEIHSVLSPNSEGFPEAVATIANGSWRLKRRSEIGSSGWVLHTFEAAVWCVARTTSFREAVLLAANLGDDADTTAAVTGQLAGAIYGADGIPAAWQGLVAWHDKIINFADQLMRQ